jgi:predicted PurR-regulated permease PerM
VSGLVAIGVLVAAIALWQLRVVLALLFLAVILASGMRPGIERLAQWRIPRAIGLLAYYLVLSGLVALVFAFVLPQTLDEVRSSLAEPVASSASGNGSGLADTIRRDAARAAARWLGEPPSLQDLVGRGLTTTRRALGIVGGIAFVLASAAYWTLAHERIQRVAVSRLRPAKRSQVLRTWDRAERRLGAYVRGQLLLIGIVATTLSTAFKLIGLPYWLLLGIFAALVEIIPMIGPLAAGIVAVGVGLTVSVHTALLVAAAVYGLRLVQDYVLVPRVIGHAVELPPLLTLVLVAIAGVSLGPAMVPFATPLAAVISVIAGRERAE